MQELEKILEEMQEVKEIMLSPQNIDCFGEPCKENDCCACVINKCMEIVKKHMNDGWIPVDKYGLPKDEGVYDLTIIDGLGVYDSVRWQFLGGTHLSGTQHYVDGVHYWADNYRGGPINKFLSKRVIAWRKKPEPYRPERSDSHDGE